MMLVHRSDRKKPRDGKNEGHGKGSCRRRAACGDDGVRKHAKRRLSTGKRLHHATSTGTAGDACSASASASHTEGGNLAPPVGSECCGAVVSWPRGCRRERTIRATAQAALGPARQDLPPGGRASWGERPRSPANEGLQPLRHAALAAEVLRGRCGSGTAGQRDELCAIVTRRAGLGRPPRKRTALGPRGPKDA